MGCARQAVADPAAIRQVHDRAARNADVAVQRTAARSCHAASAFWSGNRSSQRTVQGAVTTTLRWLGPLARWLLVTVALVLVSASCGVRPAASHPAQPSAPTVLISGVVDARPGCPVERPSRLCKPRPVGEVRVEARSLPAGVTVSTRTRADGYYSLRLRKGRYVLVTMPRRVIPRCPHVLIAVTSLAPVRANINCDSGIR
jgi:hypothetical protein